MQASTPSATTSHLDVYIALLNWPVLLFIFLVLFIFLFRGKVIGLFERGDIQISWGDRQIRLRELSENMDGELDPIREDIAALRAEVEALKRGGSVQDAAVAASGGLPEIDEGQRADAKSRLLEALQDGKFTWRSIERLSAIAGVSEAEVRDILRSDAGVAFSVGKSGRQIAKLKSR